MRGDECAGAFVNEYRKERNRGEYCMREGRSFEDDQISCLQNLIVCRQLLRRGDIYEEKLWSVINDYSEKCRTIVTYIGNFFLYCKYSSKADKGIPFFKEMDFL